ncbi:hypothetical protein ASG40_03555 [Methylobacterium sp. Leaf399]|uniref:4-fold beta flower protein n=1 Tax=unclassified Methylobacterium TaxID=2615210 RepID=UPI00070032EA|nr:MULTISPECIES: hypothetical protein [unclassified Methylobacterium]KQP60656.1 hypothetical protein ASF39_16000 [Methylobacterium sp. Leaf108]KQT19889.1 hypothetical protein ASG40_03555 [Methylobacterium sp. Leaf399]KQT78409.1 hypothetical protein ASG59_07970 [Methylobacterium sp. Leaf466]
MIAFYDRQGRATAFCEDGASLYFWDGRPAAYLDGDMVVDYGGRPIGWLQDGWITDLDGHAILFESDAIRGPAKPERLAKAVPAPRRPRPAKADRTGEAPPRRPVSSTSWSERSFSQLL